MNTYSDLKPVSVTPCEEPEDIAAEAEKTHHEAFISLNSLFNNLFGPIKSVISVKCAVIYDKHSWGVWIYC